MHMSFDERAKHVNSYEPIHMTVLDSKNNHIMEIGTFVGAVRKIIRNPQDNPLKTDESIVQQTTISALDTLRTTSTRVIERYNQLGLVIGETKFQKKYEQTEDSYKRLHDLRTSISTHIITGEAVNEGITHYGLIDTPYYAEKTSKWKTNSYALNKNEERFVDITRTVISLLDVYEKIGSTENEQYTIRLTLHATSYDMAVDKPTIEIILLNTIGLLMEAIRQDVLSSPVPQAAVLKKEKGNP